MERLCRLSDPGVILVILISATCHMGHGSPGVIVLLCDPCGHTQTVSVPIIRPMSGRDEHVSFAITAAKPRVQAAAYTRITPRSNMPI